MAIGIVVGGILGAQLSGHAYVEAAGTSNPVTREFIDRFTSFWTGVDELGMAQALATQHKTNLSFVREVFLSLNDDYSTDADDIALEYVKITRKNHGLSQSLQRNRALRKLLIRLPDEGWTSSEEMEAIRYLRQH